ncbi:MAG: class I SAM-dependent methyltransferase [Gimesia chilikensis]|uniref:class I SAM-dependent methyltransferase n=1 Tax=Gimesia chilikensis TaxID=2605989 RepID=UPI003788DFEE
MNPTDSNPIRQTKFGPSAPGLGWVPAPRYILRRSRILQLFRNLPRGRVLEIGCGSGALLSELSELGFHCTALEMSEQARQLATQFNVNHASVTIYEEPQSNWQEHFDYVLSFEVLEHIEDDESALREWTTWIKPGGHILLSVPAHQKMWNDADIWAGHYRRYERKQLSDLFKKVGSDPEVIESYGYPLANWVEPIRASFCRNRIKDGQGQQRTRKKFTETSGTDRSTEVQMFPLFGKFPGSLAMQAFCQIQRAFLRTDLGNGYLVWARRQSIHE